MDIINRYESNVRGYCRNFPVVFETAQGHVQKSVDGREYIDFFAGAGALNYGHNNPLLQEKLIAHIAGNGVTHSLDMATVAKERFLESFQKTILEPRNMRYKVQFPGPTGTNAVESALKLARKITERHHVVSFTNGFHGMTLGSLAVTGNGSKRAGAGVPLSHASQMPFDHQFGDDTDTLEFFRCYLENTSSGLDLPAAVIVETIQAEGGVNVASMDWLKGLEELCREYGMLLIIDDIQVGCGRTGSFFSFEAANISPDIICLSKSISGYGLPMAIVLMKPEHDVWEPGEHNGTFRGHNPAFVTATASMAFWQTDELEKDVVAKGKHAIARLESLSADYPEALGEVRGRGLIIGLDCMDELAGAWSKAAFDRGLIIETAGPSDNVLKLLPPLTIPLDALDAGIDILEAALPEALRAIGVSPDTARSDSGRIAGTGTELADSLVGV